MLLTANGIELHVEVHGDGDAEPVLLLHGWPDSAALWRHQVPALTEAGYRVIAPDLRGFGRSDRPDGVDSYTLANSVADVAAIMLHGRVRSVGPPSEIEAELSSAYLGG